jgi:hypothetical protein
MAAGQARERDKIGVACLIFSRVLALANTLKRQIHAASFRQRLYIEAEAFNEPKAHAA